MNADAGRVEITKARRTPTAVKSALLLLRALVARSGDPRDLLALAVVAAEVRQLRAERDELRELRELRAEVAAAGDVPRWGVRFRDGTVEEADDEDDACAWLRGACTECPPVGLVVAHDRVLRGEWRAAP